MNTSSKTSGSAAPPIRGAIRTLIEKMDWFFDQWVYATALPQYRFAYKIKKRNDGKYLVRCKFEQHEVPEDFKVYLDLHIDFGDDRFARIGLFIDKPVSEIDLPLMPLKPKKIILNNLKSTSL